MHLVETETATTFFPLYPARQSRLDTVDFKRLTFGKEPTDHFFTAEYRDGAWQQPQTEPFRNLEMSPFALCLHYGQTVFEGMKAFRMTDGGVSVFRLERHYERFVRSLDRMCMPAVPFSYFEQGMLDLIRTDIGWVPDSADASLYLRPFMIATEERLGVKESDSYLFMITATPVGAYYAKPLRVKVETEFVRAAPGGAGFAKNGGNYGAAFYPARQARAEGFDQVLWTDSATHANFEESGTMNLMFIIGDTLLTPSLDKHTILDGVTRDTLLTLAPELGLRTEIRPVSVAEIAEALAAGHQVEAFGAGTAAVVAPIEWIQFGTQGYTCYTAPDARMFELKNRLQAIRSGAAPDVYGWNTLV